MYTYLFIFIWSVSNIYMICLQGMIRLQRVGVRGGGLCSMKYQGMVIQRTTTTFLKWPGNRWYIGAMAANTAGTWKVPTDKETGTCFELAFSFCHSLLCAIVGINTYLRHFFVICKTAFEYYPSERLERTLWNGVDSCSVICIWPWSRYARRSG